MNCSSREASAVITDCINTPITGAGHERLRSAWLMTEYQWFTDTPIRATGAAATGRNGA
jgi:hypothetical protein